MSKPTMKGKAITQKIREYTHYIDRHLDNIATSWQVLQKKCKDMRFIYDDFVFGMIHAHVEAHDLSKLSPEEFIAYQRNFFPVKAKEGSSSMTPEFRAAWEHHKENNPHHWQHWTALPSAERGVGSPYACEAHCVCMVIDWMAMGLEFGDTAEDYYKNNADKIELPDWAVTLIEQIFDRTREP